MFTKSYSTCVQHSMYKHKIRYTCDQHCDQHCLCNNFPDIQKSTGKIRTLYISSYWIEMVFIIEEKYEENETWIVQSLIKSID